MIKINRNPRLSPNQTPFSPDDAVKVIPNRYNLTLAAATRARQLATGHKPTVEVGVNKEAVIALREIAERKVDGDQLLENVVKSRGFVRRT